ncbi:ABC transporter permease [Gelidibacter salicanalis]|uniref:ABC transporter permease n=1 Tax=Gelidibacter salicanalis TaxID=291193 RepID=A0A934KHX7_9FLAO|nr:ABC transporter permease [Gelidibacter salicanalis]MBJ7879846.1 ABC transporter permease [Gelidibacter salicanalis]
MIRNYFKIALRNLWKNKGFTAINLLGLVIGMTAVILIGTWIQNELSFERFHTNEKSLYKVYNRSTGPGEISTWDITSGPLGKALENDFPEVENSARIYWSAERLFGVGDKSIKTKGNEVDGSFLRMFSFPLLQGNSDDALEGVNNIVITKTLAIKLFGDTDPINKEIKIDNETNYKVTGILKDLPSNTAFDFEYLISLKGNETKYSGSDAWGINTFYTYIQLKPNTLIVHFNEKIKNLVERKSDKYKWEIFLYPVSQSHLYSRFENGKVAGGHIETVRLMAIIGGLILLIACINFMNLSTAQSQKRAKEVGVRKVIGAGKSSLISQFLCESILLAAIGGILALVIAAVYLPYFNQLIEKSLMINFLNPLLWLGLGGFVLFTGLLAGSYPAFYLSSFTPVKVLKGAFKGVKSSFNPRKTLVVLQFSVGIALVIATIVIYQQINFTQNRATGYNVNNLVQVRIEGDIKKNYDLIKTELLSARAVTAMSKTGWGVTVDGSNGSGFKWDGMEQENLNFSLYRTGGNFAKTMDLKLVDGRDIDFSLFPGDSSSVMINETAVKKMGLKDPIGKLIRKDDSALTIVGVFNDFIIGSPYDDVRPMLVFGSVDGVYNIVMRLNGLNDTAKNLKIAADVFSKYNPAYPFTYHFVDQEYAEKFKDEKQIASLSSLFAGLTIFISCLGLFGLAAYMAQNRSKEIGIRKVLGASVGGIVKMLSKEFIMLVVIAIVIAVPISWYFMSEWLQDFTYRIDLEWISFVYAGVGTLLIALLTVSFQAIKAAIVNPVESLKTE